MQGVKPNDVTYCSLLTRQIAQGRVDLLEPTLDRMRQVISPHNPSVLGLVRTEP
jgi:hypothetical protein